MSFSRSFRPRSEPTNDETNDGNDVTTTLLGTDLRGVPREWRRPAFSELFLVRGEDATKNTHTTSGKVFVFEICCLGWLYFLKKGG